MGKFYVYHLVDPRDGHPFYVGKGKGNRLREHETEARRGVTSEKCNRIRQIWAANLAVSRLIVKSFEDEEDALAFEYEQIRALPNLTNCVHRPGYPQADPDALGYVTADMARVIAWVLKLSNSFQTDIRFEARGNATLEAVFGAFNALGPVQYTRDLLRRWIKQDGEIAVRARLATHGVTFQS